MKSHVEKIIELVKWIPPKDIPYANTFIERRDFESLRDLVKSDIVILRRKRNEHLSEQIEMLIQMKAEIDSYLLLLGLDEGDTANFWE